MAKISVCDICGKRPVREIQFTVGREMDAAGDTDLVVKTAELCLEHIVIPWERLTLLSGRYNDPLGINSTQQEKAWSEVKKLIKTP